MGWNGVNQETATVAGEARYGMEFNDTRFKGVRMECTYLKPQRDNPIFEQHP